MNIDFELVFVYALMVSGAIWLFDAFFLAPKRQARADKIKELHGEDREEEIQQALTMPTLVDYARSFFPLILIVFLIRSFVFEPFRIPSGSLKPTLLINDFIIVNKFSYGFRIPVLRKKIIPVGEPHRGDIAVFRYPDDPKINYIKRIVGLPGDTVSYIDKKLYINGKEAPQQSLGFVAEMTGYGSPVKVEKRSEKLNSLSHEIYIRPNRLSESVKDVVVPKGMYFAMGDNRDDSNDSRAWGFVPEANFVGRAYRVLMSWNKYTHNVRWQRIGKKIH